MGSQTPQDYWVTTACQSEADNLVAVVCFQTQCDMFYLAIVDINVYFNPTLISAGLVLQGLSYSMFFMHL